VFLFWSLYHHCVCIGQCTGCHFDIMDIFMSLLWSYVVFYLYSNAVCLETWMKILKLCVFIKNKYLMYFLQWPSHWNWASRVNTESESILGRVGVGVGVLKLWLEVLNSAFLRFKKAGILQLLHCKLILWYKFFNIGCLCENNKVYFPLFNISRLYLASFCQNKLK